MKNGKIYLSLPSALASRDSKVGFPIVSGNKRLVNPDNIDKTPIKMNGNDGFISFKLSVRNGAGVAPTRAENEAKLSPWVLENQMYQFVSKE